MVVVFRVPYRTFIALALLWAQGTLSYPISFPFFDPLAGGGSWLDHSGNGLGEPLNVIISGQSSLEVLTDSGFVDFARAVGFSTECFGMHLGVPQSANLGDGNGLVNQTMELRQNMGFTKFGTCIESVLGGNHLRMFRQNGPTANTGALFLAVSQEKDIFHHHDISPNGYDIGRNEFVVSAVGTTSFGGVTYSTEQEELVGHLPPGSSGLNHDVSTDGHVILLTVIIQ